MGNKRIPAYKMLNIVTGGRKMPSEPLTNEQFQANRDQIHSELVRIGNLIWRGGLRSILDEIDSILKDEIEDLQVALQGVVGDLDQEQDEDAMQLWLLVLPVMLAGHQERVVSRIRPSIQSIIAQGYERSLPIIGGTQQTLSSAFLRVAATISERFGIEGPFRQRIENLIGRNIASGASFQETLDDLFLNRMSIANATTIAMTEGNHAVNQGLNQAYQDTGAVTVGVFGCQFLEPEWMINVRGVQVFTCNARNLTPQEASGLRHHPNHVGVLSPMSFRREDGTYPPIPAPSNGGGTII